MQFKPVPRPLKYLLWGALGVVTFFFLLLAIVRSQFVLSRVLPPIQSKIEHDFHVKAKITSLSIDPFARVALEGVQAEWNDPTLGQVKIDLNSLLLRFSFWPLFDRKLKISEIELDSPRITADLNLPRASTVPKSPENPLPMLKNLMLNPPASLNLNAFSVRNSLIDLRLKQGDLKSHLHIDNLNFFADILFEKRRFESQVKVTLGDERVNSKIPGLFQIEAAGLSPELPFVQFQTMPSLQFESTAELSFEDDSKPQFKLDNVIFDLSGEKVQFLAKILKGGTAQIECQSLKLSKKVSRPLRFDLSSLFKLSGLSGDEFERQMSGQVVDLIKQFDTAVAANLSAKRINGHFNLPAQGVDAALVADFDVPVQFDIASQSIEISSHQKPLALNIEQFVLKGPTFRALNDNIKLSTLFGSRLQVPFSVTITRPSLKNLKKPLDGIRFLVLEARPQLTWSSSDERLLDAKLTLNQSDSGEWNLSIANDLYFKERLLKLVPAMRPVHDSLGFLKLNSDLKVKLNTVWRDLQILSETRAAGVRNVTLDYKLNLNQLSDPPQNSSTALRVPGGLQVSGQLIVRQPMTLPEVKSATQVNWAEKPLLKNQLTLRNLPKRLMVEGETEVAALLRLMSVTPLAAQLGMLGGSQINAKWNLILNHQAESILKASLSPLSLLNVDFGVEAKVDVVEKPVLPLFEKNFLRLTRPVKASIKAALQRGLVDVRMGYNLPKTELSSLAAIERLSGDLRARTSLDLKSGINLDVKANLAALNPAKDLSLPAEVIPYLKDISTHIALRSDIKNRVDITTGTVETGKDKFKMSFRGGTDIKASNSRFDGQLTVSPPKVFRFGIRAQDNVAMDGSIQVGWELTQKEQKAIRLRGRAGLNGFALQHALGGFKNATGQIPFEQDLELPNLKSLRWSYLIQENPFQRVDTTKFSPLLNEESTLVIEEFNALNRSFGPFRGRFSLKQNMLTIDRLDADLFDGVLTGQGFVDVHPARLLAGLQGRVTKLNSALLSLKKEKQSSAPLSARLALVAELSKALVEGRVDVTEIGKNQLLALIDVLDPSGADPLLNKARLALAVGYPTYVGIQMQQGFMDLDVQLGGLISQQIKIPHLPLTPIINAKTQDLVKTIREVPIR